MNAPSERRLLTYPPALPEPRGVDERKVAFFREAGAGFEFMALWHSLDIEGQATVRIALHAAAAASAERAIKK